MKLIPVIDLMDARVVTAKHGQRHTYVPSDTPLCRSCDPQDVMSALLRIHPFDTFYIADLDAISGNGSNLEVIDRLVHTYRNITFWVDNGLTQLHTLGLIARPVIGTESLDSFEQLAHLLTSLPSPILSVDYLDQLFKGPSGLDCHTQCWPDDVIVMSLSRVGSASGPDMKRLQRLANQLPETRLYAAGGIRDRQDLEQLRSFGIAGVLLSTALHQGVIDSMEIDLFIRAAIYQ
jgi:phosphoribosylformimino-5-aminoimidazole carboxamide ribotide isomerase